METPHVFARFDRTVLCEVLRQCDHQRTSVVQNVDFLPLPFREAVREPDGRDRHGGTDAGEDERVRSQLPERGLDVIQTFELHKS